MRTTRAWLGAVAAAVLSLWASWASAVPVFTGNVEADFTGPGVVTVSDPRDVDMQKAFAGCISGWDIEEVRLCYDALTDTLYVGVAAFGIFGDADGDGDPGGSSPALLGEPGVDAPDLGEGETFYAAVDVNQDMRLDVVAGVPYSADVVTPGGFRVAAYNTSVNTAPFGEPLPGVTSTVFGSPSAAAPDLEFTIANISKVSGFASPDSGLVLSVLIVAGSAVDGGIGADQLLAVWVYVPAFGAIGGTVWSDDNGDGVQDDGELGLATVTVELYADLDPKGELDAAAQRVATTLTDAEGHYSFNDLLPGDYLVSVMAAGSLPEDMDLTGGQDPFPVVLAEGQVFLEADIGYRTPPPKPPPPAEESLLAGRVYLDTNANGVQDGVDTGLQNVVIEVCTSCGCRQIATSDANGDWAATAVPGEFTVTVCTPPANCIQTEGSNPTFVSAKPGLNDGGTDGYAPAAVGTGATATIGFWQNPNGQALIASLNGGPAATDLGLWLAAAFPRIWGIDADGRNLGGQTNAEIAAYAKALFAVKGMKLDLQVLGVALAVYVTDPALGGSELAAAYGFTAPPPGTATMTYNIGNHGTAFGVPDNTTLTVWQILQAANGQAVNGVLYGGTPALRSSANEVFSGINETGDIR